MSQQLTCPCGASVARPSHVLGDASEFVVLCSSCGHSLIVEDQKVTRVESGRDPRVKGAMY